MKRKHDSVELSDLSDLSFKDLCGVARILRCKRAKTKPDAILGIQKVHACRKIQRFWRKRVAVNDVCPISQGPAVYPVAAVKLSRMSFVMYNHTSFLEYIRHNYHNKHILDPWSQTVLPEATVCRFRTIIERLGNIPPPESDDTQATIELVIDACMHDCVHAYTCCLEVSDEPNVIVKDLHREWFMNISQMFAFLFLIDRDAFDQKISQCIFTSKKYHF